MNTQILKLGKTPARANAIKLRMSAYLKRRRLPPTPETFGRSALITNWPMFKNDQFGDCVWAGAAHEQMLWAKEGGKDVKFTDDGVLSDYSAVTGFNRAVPGSDNGTDMQLAAKYRRNVGVIDSAGVRHKIGAYLALEPGNLDDLYAASYLFGAVGIGLDLPQSAMDAFDKKGEWLFVKGSPSIGGHYVPLVGRKDGTLRVVTWGRNQLMSTKFLQKFCDEAVAYVSEERLTNGKSLDGFDMPALMADLAAL